MGRSLQHITGCEKALPGRDQGGEGSHPVKDLGWCSVELWAAGTSVCLTIEHVKTSKPQKAQDHEEPSQHFADEAQCLRSCLPAKTSDRQVAALVCPLLEVTEQDGIASHHHGVTHDDPAGYVGARRAMARMG